MEYNIVDFFGEKGAEKVYDTLVDIYQQYGLEEELPVEIPAESDLVSILDIAKRKSLEFLKEESVVLTKTTLEDFCEGCTVSDSMDLALNNYEFDPKNSCFQDKIVFGYFIYALMNYSWDDNKEKAFDLLKNDVKRIKGFYQDFLSRPTLHKMRY